MNEVLRSILDSNTVTNKSGIVRPLRGGISPDEGARIQELIRQHRPRVTLEVGCAYGISSLYICEALREVGGTKHIIIDPYQNRGWEGIGFANLERAGYSDFIECHETTSYECLPMLLARGQRIDFALIDGQHTFDYVLVDFFYIDKMLSIGGHVVFDDANYPSIHRVCRYVLTNLPYVSIEQTGLSVRSRVISLLANLSPLKRVVKPELSVRDGMLGIGWRRFVAIEKKADDFIQDVAIFPKATRRWDTHNPF
jgi:predicted O-methyltransferase YrrM